MFIKRNTTHLSGVLFLTPVFVALLALCGCVKERTVDEEKTGSPVTFIPVGIEKGEEQEAETKAVTPTTSLDGTGFYVSAVRGTPGSDTERWTNVHFSKSGDSFKGGKYWSTGSDQNYRFFASNASLSYSSSGATVSVTNGTDVVCAYKPDPVYGARNTLQFDHIFARISTVTVAATAPYNISDVSISIVNVKTGGTYNLYSGAGQSSGTGWSALTPSDPSETQLYSYSGTITSGTSHQGSDNDLYVVPGLYQLKAYWVAGVGDYSQTYSSKTSVSNVSIQAGMINSISCSLSGDATSLTFSVSVTPWGVSNRTATF